MAESLRYAAEAGPRTGVAFNPSSVKFLVDQNPSLRLAAALVEHGHDAVHTSDLGLDRAPDEAVRRIGLGVTERLNFGHGTRRLWRCSAGLFSSGTSAAKSRAGIGFPALLARRRTD